MLLLGLQIAAYPSQAQAANAPADPEFSRLFSQVLADPTNVDLGHQYAQAALARGEARKALSTYERILLQDPDNDMAQTNLARVRLLIAPDITSWRAEAGFGAASNARHVATGETSEIFGRASLSVRDERTMADMRLRSLASIRYDQHTDIDDLSAGLATASTGPLLSGYGSWVFRPAVGVSYAWVDERTLYFETFGEFGAENFTAGAINAASLRIAHRNVASHVSSKDGFVADLSGFHSRRGVVTPSDVVSVSARIRYSEGLGSDDKDNDPSTPLFPSDYTEFRGKIGYFLPLYENYVSGGPTFTAYSRNFRTPVSGGGSNRHDVYFAPGANVSVSNVCGSQCQLKFDYRYETTNSNDPARDITNHVGGARVVVAF